MLSFFPTELKNWAIAEETKSESFFPQIDIRNRIKFRPPAKTHKLKAVKEIPDREDISF